jgi:class 3 adenylate cyclase
LSSEARWRDHLDQFRQVAIAVIARFGGEMAGGGTEEICAHFASPARAIGCALALRDAAGTLELKLALGVTLAKSRSMTAPCRDMRWI